MESQTEEQAIQEAFLAAIREAKTGVESGHGGPFGAAVVKDGQMVAMGHNTVIRDSDPTAHAEVNAIRAAGRALGTHDLSGCILVASSEPCPMCLASSYWANVREVRFALKRETAESVGFRDIWIDEDIMKPMAERKLKLIHHPEFPEAEGNFRLWSSLNGRIY